MHLVGRGLPSPIRAGRGGTQTVNICDRPDTSRIFNPHRTWHIGFSQAFSLRGDLWRVSTERAEQAPASVPAATGADRDGGSLCTGTTMAGAALPALPACWWRQQRPARAGRRQHCCAACGSAEITCPKLAARPANPELIPPTGCVMQINRPAAAAVWRYISSPSCRHGSPRPWE